MRLPWYAPLALLLLALLGLALLGLLWLLGALALLGGSAYLAWRRLSWKVFRRRWRRLPPPR
ncbi:hypothetical protein [Thermus sp.]